MRSRAVRRIYSVPEALVFIVGRSVNITAQPRALRVPPLALPAGCAVFFRRCNSIIPRPKPVLVRPGTVFREGKALLPAPTVFGAESGALSGAPGAPLPEALSFFLLPEAFLHAGKTQKALGLCQVNAGYPLAKAG